MTLNIEQIKKDVQQYNSLLHSILGGIKRAFETPSTDDPTQARIKAELTAKITETQRQLTAMGHQLDDQIQALSDDVLALAAKVDVVSVVSDRNNSNIPQGEDETSGDRADT